MVASSEIVVYDMDTRQVDDSTSVIKESNYQDEMCDKLIQVSFAKIVNSKSERGGVRLHKNLLILHLLQKARSEQRNRLFHSSSPVDTSVYDVGPMTQPDPIGSAPQSHGESIFMNGNDVNWEDMQMEEPGNTGSMEQDESMCNGVSHLTCPTPSPLQNSQHTPVPSSSSLSPSSSRLSPPADRSSSSSFDFSNLVNKTDGIKPETDPDDVTEHQPCFPILHNMSAGSTSIECKQNKVTSNQSIRKYVQSKKRKWDCALVSSFDHNLWSSSPKITRLSDTSEHVVEHIPVFQSDQQTETNDDAHLALAAGLYDDENNTSTNGMTRSISCPTGLIQLVCQS